MRTGAFRCHTRHIHQSVGTGWKKRRLPIIGVKACSSFPNPIWWRCGTGGGGLPSALRSRRRSPERISQVDVIVAADAQQLAPTGPHPLARLEDVGHLEADGVLRRLVLGDTGLVVEQDQVVICRTDRS